MSRRPPNPAAERAAQNQQTLKSLLKLEPNKVCADCKRNKHPRWASWNLGIFVCIRCSGIHRSMGTHISRVKSVDLDSWTDEQLQSIMSWGNARANKYWEAKLAPGHVPSESKIENFIRTKYELKRWVMDGPIPDPATLDVDADDNIPLSLVKEKQTIDRKESIRKTSVGKTNDPRGLRQPGAAAGPSSSGAAPPKAAPVIDLIDGGDDTLSAPPRASSAAPTTQAQTRGPAVPPKPPSNTKDSLLGLDFLGPQPSAPARPSSTTGTAGSTGQSRPDLKQSILSLYATAPRTQTATQPAAQAGGGFGGLGSPTMSHASTGSGGGGGFVDGFSSLSFSNTTTSAAPPKPADAFSGLTSMSTGSRQAAPAPAASSSAFGGLSGGSFFDTKPAAPAPAPVQAKPVTTSSSAFGGLGGFGDFSSPAPAAAKPAAPAASSSNAFGDMFDFSPAPTTTSSAPVPQPTSSVNPPPGASSSMNSVFNLSSPVGQPAAKAAPTTATSPASPLAAVTANWSNSDVWNDNAWGATETAPAPAAAAPLASTIAPPASTSSTTKSPGLGGAAGSTNDFGWGSSSGSFASQSIVPGAGGGFSPAPKVTEDEEFGGWASSTAAGGGVGGAGGASGNGKPASGGGFGGAQNEDLFSNVWG